MKKKRIAIYLDEEEHLKLRAKLILLGETVSGWMRKKINKFLK